jgi:hypothetical protein
MVYIVIRELLATFLLIEQPLQQRSPRSSRSFAELRFSWDRIYYRIDLLSLPKLANVHTDHP